MSNKSYRTYFIKTFGCQMNHSDSERIASFLEDKGFSLSDKMENATMVIINTCGVRKAAEDRVYSLVHNLRKNHETCSTKHVAQNAKSNTLNLEPRTSNLEPAIVITGCIAHRKDVQRRMKDKVDLFTEIKDFPEKVSGILHPVSSMNTEKIPNTKYQILNTPTNKEQIDYLSIDPKHANDFQAYVPIMTGCNNFCTYCVVPYARGREVSRSADEIIAEVKDLVSRGYKMITLLGQNVNSYKSPVHNVCKVGKVHNVNKAQEVNFAKLLKKLNNIPGVFWISFVSSHPKDMSDEAIEVITKSKKVCECVHLPIQAGNDEVLRRMNRKYTSKHYLGLVRKFKAAFKKNKPDVLYSLTSDIIVGFPGEKRTQFQDSAIIMEKAKYDMVYFGQFSPRPGTAAWKMKDNVSKKEKVRRENVLNEILKKTTFANNKKYANKTLPVFIEKQSDNYYFGKTRTMKNVKIMSEKKNLVGKIVKVNIIKANQWNLEGEIK